MKKMLSGVVTLWICRPFLAILQMLHEVFTDNAKYLPACKSEEYLYDSSVEESGLLVMCAVLGCIDCDLLTKKLYAKILL